jgi:prepilin-type N-terminal cleavage/methylation domain-containing protein
MRSSQLDMERGYSFIELLIVVLIVGILVSFATPQFLNTKERALDNEAKANLRLIQAAQKIYKMESPIDEYYPLDGSSQDDIGIINTNLRLSLPAAANWGYTAYDTGQTKATRSGMGGRVWTLNAGVDNPTCAGSNCPPP